MIHFKASQAQFANQHTYNESKFLVLALVTYVAELASIHVYISSTLHEGVCSRGPAD